MQHGVISKIAFFDDWWLILLSEGFRAGLLCHQTLIRKGNIIQVQNLGECCKNTEVIPIEHWLDHTYPDVGGHILR